MLVRMINKDFLNKFSQIIDSPKDIVMGKEYE